MPYIRFTKIATSSVTRPKVDVFFLLFIDFYFYYKYRVSVISFAWQLVQINQLNVY